MVNRAATSVTGTVFRATKYVIEDNHRALSLRLLRIGTSIRRNTTALCSNAEDARSPW